MKYPLSVLLSPEYLQVTAYVSSVPWTEKVYRNVLQKKMKFLEIHRAVPVMDRFLVKFQALVCIFTEKKSISRVFLWILQSF